MGVVKSLCCGMVAVIAALLSGGCVSYPDDNGFPQIVVFPTTGGTKTVRCGEYRPWVIANTDYDNTELLEDTSELMRMRRGWLTLAVIKATGDVVLTVAESEYADQVRSMEIEFSCRVKKDGYWETEAGKMVIKQE